MYDELYILLVTLALNQPLSIIIYLDAIMMISYAINRNSGNFVYHFYLHSIPQWQYEDTWSLMLTELADFFTGITLSY